MVYGEAEQIVLPNTGIQAYISTKAFPISKNRSNHGIIPRYVVQPSLSDLLTGKDPAKTRALQLLRD